MTAIHCSSLRTGTDTETYSVALSFEDGVTRFITCRDDQTVADASYRQRINIPLDCRDGACGTCKALCESGNYDGGTYIDDALPPDEAAAGYVLPCSMKPRSDLVLQIASTSDVAKTQAATYTGTLTKLDRLSATTVAIGVEIPNRAELAFLPGQYVNIAVPGTDQSRSYSFSNAPHDELLTFLVKLTPGGAMSEYLASARCCRRRDHRSPVPTGRSSCGRPIARCCCWPAVRGWRRCCRCCVPFGTRTAGAKPTSSTASAPTRTWWHSTRSKRSPLLYQDSPGITASRTQASRADNKGYVTSLIEPAHLYDGDVAVYLCGPPPMVEAVRTHVTEAGIEPTGFYYEKFALAHVGGAPERESSESVPAGPEQALQFSGDARCIAGQAVLPQLDIAAYGDSVPRIDDGKAIRSIAGQLMAPVTESEVSNPLDADDGALILSGARNLAGQVVFDSVEPGSVQPPVEPVVTQDGYQIGEEHPEVHASDALFEARQALELGALELTLGRLTSQQLAGYRLLAESTMPYVEDDHFVDAAQYTETNAAFHDYLFTLTGNRAPPAGLSGPRGEGPHERGSAQRDVVSPPVRTGPCGHRQRIRGRRP